MKRKSIIILIIAVVVLASVVGACVFVMNLYNQTLQFTPQENTVINYNNYAAGNSVDYRNGRFAWSNRTIFGVTGTVVHADGQVQKIHGAGEQIQLLDGGTAFLDESELFINKEGKTCIARNVDSFVAIGTDILYSQCSDSYESTLYWYDAKAETSKVVAQNVDAYCVDEHKLIVLDNSGWVTLYTETAVEKKIKLEVPRYPITLMLQDNNLLYRSLNGLHLVNLDTGAEQEIVLSEGEYVNDRISFICDKDHIVCSFQATRTQGSDVSNIASPNNGVWLVDTIALEKQKLCDEAFGELYLWGDMLIGKNETGTYQISMTNGEIASIFS